MVDGLTNDPVAHATLILAAVAAIAAVATAASAIFIAMEANAVAKSVKVAQRALSFEIARQAFSVTPLLVADLVPVDESSDEYYLKIVNRGLGPAANILWSCVRQGVIITAAQDPIGALGVGDSYVSTFAKWYKVDLDKESIYHLLLKYDDLFDNHYRTEYVRFSFRDRYYTWRRPWIGKDSDLAGPPFDSAERSWKEEHQERMVVYRDPPNADKPTVYEQDPPARPI